ncbi:hypothetical protein ABEG18_20050 [Alsobacter sp. KACC 23698]|uniref:RebB like protein n=1 Tax=Alsobacter sp. KACC 23698 TaxID=3149229 RepID=A0AAU7JD91_9HYPH
MAADIQGAASGAQSISTGATSSSTGTAATHDAVMKFSSKVAETVLTGILSSILADGGE